MFLAALLQPETRQAVVNVTRDRPAASAWFRSNA